MPRGIPINGKKNVTTNKGWFKKGNKYEFKKGNQYAKLNIGKKEGYKNWNWKGGIDYYHTTHRMIKRKKGFPKKCEHCGKIGKKIKGQWNIQWANIDHKYRRVLEDYIGLCALCHARYDRENN
jgi:hypothetical protein